VAAVVPALDQGADPGHELYRAVEESRRIACLVMIRERAMTRLSHHNDERRRAVPTLSAGKPHHEDPSPP
jgi:hypothetical protein